MSETVIKVENLTKFYQLGLINHGTLAKDLQGWWAKLRGRDDPNSRISLINSRNNDQNTDFIYALKDVSFDVQQGEVLGIIGANGAGKSTLLKILSRVTSPTSGCIKIKGRIGSLLEVGTGFHPELTGRENIYLNGAILGMRRWEIDKKLDEIIDFSGVEKFIDTPVKRYSSGMYVKLAFSVAAHLDAEIMIMDEVLAVGDINFQQKCLQKMNDVAKTDGRTILYVSHNMGTIRKLCDRCIVLEKGNLIYDGEVEEGINIYARQINPSGKKTSFSFQGHKMYSDTKGECLIETITIEKFVVSYSDILKFSINIFCKRDKIDNACLRIILRKLDDSIIGTTYSECFYLKKGNNKINLSMQTNHLVPGSYMIDPILVENVNNGQIKQDAVGKTMPFEINTGMISNIDWRKISGPVFFDEVSASRDNELNTLDCNTSNKNE